MDDRTKIVDQPLSLRIGRTGMVVSSRKPVYDRGGDAQDLASRITRPASVEESNLFSSWNARAVGLSMSAEEAIQVAADEGFDGVDLMVRDLLEAGSNPRELRRRMDDLGLRGGAWPLPVAWRGDAERFREDLRSLPAMADAAATLGLTRTGTWVLPECLSPPADGTGLEADELRYTLDIHLDRLGAIASTLDAYGCGLGLEIMGSPTARSGLRMPFIQRYAELETLLGALRHEHGNVGVLADAFHLFAAGEPFAAACVWGAPSVIWVHVADAVHDCRERLEDRQRALPGLTGIGEAVALLRLLRNAGYDGPVTAEPLGLTESVRAEPVSRIARRTFQALRGVWPTGGAENPHPRGPVNSD